MTFHFDAKVFPSTGKCRSASRRAPEASSPFMMWGGRPGTLSQPEWPSKPVTLSPPGKCMTETRWSRLAVDINREMLSAESGERTFFDAAGDFLDGVGSAHCREIFVEQLIGCRQRGGWLFLPSTFGCGIFCGDQRR